MTKHSSDASLPSLEAYYSLGEAAFEEILGRFAPLKPQNLVEFGSGHSTVRFASALPDTRITSVENGDDYARRSRALLAEHGLHNATVLDAPIRRQRFGLAWYHTYDFAPACMAQLPGEIDVALIDGPPGRFIGGREAVLYAIFDRIRVGGIVVLDDLFRHHEQRAMVHWQQRYPGAFEVDMSDTGHQLAYLTKRSAVKFSSSAAVSWGHLKAQLARQYFQRKSRGQ